MNARDFKYGIILFLCFVIYFLLLSINNYYFNSYLRIGNVVFHSIIVYLAISRFHDSAIAKKRFNYLSGFMAGFKPSIIATVLFAVFQFFYLTFNTHFLEGLKSTSPIQDFLTPVTAPIVVLFEGVAISLILSYLILRIIVRSEEN